MEKTIQKLADEYVGHPFENGENISTTQKRKAFMDGFKEALELPEGAGLCAAEQDELYEEYRSLLKYNSLPETDQFKEIFFAGAKAQERIDTLHWSGILRSFIGINTDSFLQKSKKLAEDFVFEWAKHFNMMIDPFLPEGYRIHKKVALKIDKPEK